MQPKSLRQLLEEPRRPKAYISRPIIPAGGIVVLGGEEKTYKSMVAINMGLDLAEGTPILGRWNVVKEQTVMYVEQELGEDLLRERMEVIMGGRISTSVARDNFHYISKNLDIVLDTPEGQRILTRDIEQVKPTVLVLDPFMFFHDQDENDNNRIKQIVRVIKRITQQHKLTTIVVHHAGKPSEYRATGHRSSLRGASALAGAADSIIMLHKPIASRDDVIELGFTLRCGKNPPPFKLMLNEDTFAFGDYK